MKIVCFGDSITGRSDLENYLKWSCVLECMLEARLGEGKVSVLNRGIGGDTTGRALQRFQKDVLDEKPEIVIILLGGNDAGEKRPHSEVKKNLEEIIRKCKAPGAKVLLLQYHVLINPENPETAWRHLTENNRLFTELGLAENVPVLDMAIPMQEALKSHRLTELVNGRDGVHLNAGGELIFAREVFNKLMSLGWVQG